MQIREDDLSGAETQALLRLHLEAMHANSPPGHVFALDLSGLKQPDVTVWSVWEGEALLGIGALRRLDGRTGEVKSMRTHPNHLRKGVAAFLLEHIIARARAKGLLRGNRQRPRFRAGVAPLPETRLRRRRRLRSL